MGKKSRMMYIIRGFRLVYTFKRRVWPCKLLKLTFFSRNQASSYPRKAPGCSFVPQNLFLGLFYATKPCFRSTGGFGYGFRLNGIQSRGTKTISRAIWPRSWKTHGGVHSCRDPLSLCFQWENYHITLSKASSNPTWYVAHLNTAKSGLFLVDLELRMAYTGVIVDAARP